jgi:hypothetical protein
MAEEHNARIQGKPMVLGPAPQLPLPMVGDQTKQILVVSGLSGVGAYMVTKQKESAIGFALLAGLISKYYFMTPVSPIVNTEPPKISVPSPSQPLIKPTSPPIVPPVVHIPLTGWNLHQPMMF